ncbi:MAG: hypothetical protein MSG64_20845 [Pyrinomonadaceae bacterium MAG19_C2-C3]|nr:hypothetical protein [Pyrinomonadaceae bacterium MAG19_C2-C3]
MPKLKPNLVLKERIARNLDNRKGTWQDMPHPARLYFAPDKYFAELEAANRAKAAQADESHAEIDTEEADTPTLPGA